MRQARNYFRDYCVVVVLAGISSSVVVTPGNAAPIDPAFPATIREAVAMYDAVVIAKIVGQKLEVKQVIKTMPDYDISKGSRITMSGFQTSSEEPFLICGKMNNRGTITWSYSFRVLQSSVGYICQVARLTKADKSTLKYCIRMLESKDPVVGSDAHEELSRASIKELATISNDMPHERLSLLLANEGIPAKRRSLYGLMLGLCGDMESETLLRKVIFDRSDKIKFRYWISRIICGYILLSGEKGVVDVRNRWFVDPNGDADEVSNAASGIMMIWMNAPSTLKPRNLCQAFHPLLEHKQVADVAILDLSLMKDWSVQDRIGRMYKDADSYATPDSLRKAIVEYMQMCVKDVPNDAKDVPDRVRRAENFLQTFSNSRVFRQ